MDSLDLQQRRMLVAISCGITRYVRGEAESTPRTTPYHNCPSICEFSSASPASATVRGALLCSALKLPKFSSATYVVLVPEQLGEQNTTAAGCPSLGLGVQSSQGAHGMEKDGSADHGSDRVARGSRRWHSRRERASPRAEIVLVHKLPPL
jgi:hypothetical protein